jgi:glycosyltransferase involved in cell wall biosynthesis
MARICLVTHVVAPWDGQGRVVYELARYLTGRGHSVALAARAVAPALARAPGIRWIPMSGWDRGPDLAQWGAFACRAKLALPRRTLAEFDIVHLNGAIAPIAADVNTCHFVHAGWRRTGAAAGWYQRAVAAICAAAERRAYRSAGVVAAVSAAVEESLHRDAGVPQERIRTIYTGVDAGEFRPREPGERSEIRTLLGLPDDGFLLLFVGDAKSPRKNLDLALAALRHLDSRCRLAVVGDAAGGPYPALAERLGVGARTHFLGPRRDVAACMRGADALICASRYEPASLVLLEAMASGVPVVTAASVGNAAFVVSGRNGFVLPSADDVAGAVRSLTLLAADPALRVRVGQAARHTALTLSWERMGAAYEELYAERMALRTALRPSAERRLTKTRSREGVLTP